MSIEHEVIQPDSHLELKIFDFKADSWDRFIPPHWHGSVEILFCIEGNLNIWIGTAQHLYTLSSNDMILLNSNTIHSTQSPSANHVLVVQIPLPFVHKVTEGAYNEEYVFQLNTVKTQRSSDKKVASILKEMLIHFEEPTTVNNLLVKSEIYHLFALLIKEYQQGVQYKKKLKTETNQERMKEIIDYMREHFKEDISLTDLSKEFNYSTAYFSKFFKKEIGINFSEYLKSLRMEHAHNLLLNSEWSITDIAISSGFNNVRSFYNAFDKFYKMSPSQFRKSKKTNSFR